MPRNARENIKTNYIHLIVQGINREYIFEKEEYKEEFIKILGEKSIKLVFGNEEKYIKQFKVVHERVEEIEDIKDVIDYEYNIEDIIKKYVKGIEGKLEENEIEFGKLLLEIREKCGISLRKMSKIFNINKDKINKYIHKIIDNE